MSLLPVLAFLGLYVAALSRRPTALDRLVEGAAVYLFGYAIVASLLSLFDAYRHAAAAGVLLVALAAAVVRRGAADPPSGSRPWRWASSDPKLFLVAVIYLALAAGPFENVTMTGDVAVYGAYAKNLVAWGGGDFRYQPVEAVLELTRDLPEVSQSLGGLYPRPDGVPYFQFYPGWPSVLALGISLFGPIHFRIILTVVGLLVVVLAYELLARWLEGWRLTVAALVFATNPLWIYFSKYTTTEAFLLLCVLFVAQAFVSGDSQARRLSLLALGAVAVTHISFFLYLPMLLLHGATAVWRRDREQLAHFTASTGIFVGALALGYFFSPLYFVTVFSKLGFLAKMSLPNRHLVVPVAVGAAALIACALAGWTRSRGRLETLPWPTAGCWTPAVRLWLAAILAYTVWAGYELGWTGRLIGESMPAGAWDNRVNYVNRGWPSLAHLNLVSIALGCGVVPFLAFLGLFAVPRSWRGAELVEGTRDLFLLVGILLNLSIYTFIRYDTPFNYYASRYFLPVLVPFVLLFVLNKASGWKATGFYAMTLPVVAANGLFATFLATHPERPTRNDLIQEARKVVPEGSTMLTVGRPGIHRFWATLVIYDLESQYRYLGEDPEVLRLLTRRPEAMGGELFLLSDRPLALDPDAATRSLLERRDVAYDYPLRIFYPLRARESHRAYSLYRVPDLDRLFGERTLLSAEAILRLSPSSYFPGSEPGSWSTGTFELTLEPAVAAVTRVSLTTGGKLLHWSTREAVGDRVVLEIGDAVYETALVTEHVTFGLDRPTDVSTLRIRSSTFVPSRVQPDLADDRSLGIDLTRIVLE